MNNDDRVIMLQSSLDGCQARCCKLEAQRRTLVGALREIAPICLAGLQWFESGFMNPLHAGALSEKLRYAARKAQSVLAPVEEGGNT